MTSINHKNFKSAVKGTGGVYSDIAIKLGVDRSAITHFLKRQKNQKMHDLIDQERQRLIDVAENVFKEAMSLDTQNKGLSIRNKKDLLRIKLKAAEKVVTTLGKNRGWVPREEREVSGELIHSMEALKINVIMPHDVKKSGEERKSKEEKKEKTIDGTKTTSEE